MSLTREEQSEITRVAVKAGQLMLQHGAESQLVEQTTVRVGIALGLEHVELSLSSGSIVITSLYQDRCVTTTRRCLDRGINMHMVCEVLRICVMAEKQLFDIDKVKIHLAKLTPLKYNRWLVVLMVGLSCSSFSHFFGGDWQVYWMTFIASASAMIIRQELGARHHNPFVNFSISAFIATSVASIGVFYQFGEHPEIALAASVLLLVPGFPLINAVSDILKGHINTGIARWVFASMLMLSVGIGIVASMTLTGVEGWIG